METNPLLGSLKELIEICRFKCGPFDEVILANGKSNQQSLLDAIALADQAEVLPIKSIIVQMGEESWVLRSDTGKVFNIPVEFKALFTLFVDKMKRGAAGERVAWDKLNTAVDDADVQTASKKLRKAKYTLNVAMKSWGLPVDKGDWFTRSSKGYALNASCIWKPTASKVIR